MQFGYSFEIPTNWTAIESADGYSVKDASNQETLLIYVENIQPELADIMLPDCEVMKEFSFSEGLDGQMCEMGKSLTYFLERDDKRFSFHFPDWSNLSTIHKSNGLLVVKSLLFPEQLPS